MPAIGNKTGGVSGGTAKTSKPKVVRRSSPPPVTDVQSSGGDYGTGKAQQFKKTRAYRGASRAGYSAGTPATKRAVLANPKSSTAKTVAQRTHASREAVHQKQGILGSIHLVNGHLPADLGKSSGGSGPLAFASPTLDTIKLVLGLKRPNLNVNTGPAGTEAVKVAKNAAKDVVNIPAETPSSVYKLGKDLAAQVKGELRGGPPGKGGTTTFTHDLAAPYVQLIKHPVKTFEEHPVGTALLVSGPVRSLDRAAGTVGRAVGAKSLTRVREPATVPGTELRVARPASPGLVSGSVQKALERRKVRKVDAIKAEAQVARDTGQQSRAEALQRKAVKADPRILKPRQQKRLATGLAGMNVAVQRAEKAGIPSEIGHALKHRTEAASLVTQGVVKAAPASLRESLGEYVQTLKDARENGDLSHSEQLTNEKAIAKLEKLAKSKRLDPAAEAEAAKVVRDHLVELDAKLSEAGIMSASKGERAALIPHAVTRMGAARGKLPKAERVAAKDDLAAVQSRFDAASTAGERQALRPELKRAKGAVKAAKGKRIVSATGERLPNEAIVANMEKGDYLSPPGFVSHRPGVAGKAGRFQADYPMRTLVTKARSGEAIKAGTTDLTPEAIIGHAQRRQALLSAHDGFQRTIQTAAFRDSKGAPPKVYSPAKAAKAAEDLTAQTGVPWKPVSISPWGAKQAEIRDILEGHKTDEHATKTVSDVLKEAYSGGGTGQKVLLPSHVVDELESHLSILGSGPLSKAFRTYTQGFKRVVLATSPKWLAGNTVEGSLRTAIKGAVPGYHSVFARKVLEGMAQQDEQVARALASQVVPGGHFGATARTYIQPGEFAKSIGHLPVAKQAGAVWDKYTNLVFQDVNARLIEDPLQRAIAGKVMKQQLKLSGLATHGAKAVEDAINHYKDTSNQLALGNEVRRAFGRYESFPPGMREAVMRYTPFLPWFVNAVKLMYVVLPRDHPLLTSLIADAHMASEDWRKQHGFDLWSSGARPAFLQGGIPGAGDSTLRIARYTPFGAFGDLGGTAAQQVLPQASGIISALKGQDFTGRQVKDPFQRWSQAFTGIIPLAGAGVSIGTGKGPLAKRVRKQFDPFEFTHGKPKKSSSSGTGGPTLPTLPSLPALPSLPSLPGG